MTLKDLARAKKTASEEVYGYNVIPNDREVAFSRGFDKAVELLNVEIKKLKTDLQAAREENEEMMCENYWAGRAKVAEDRLKKLEETE